MDVTAPDAPTTRYFVCTVGSHCTSGQKIAITWEAASTAVPVVGAHRRRRRALRGSNVCADELLRAGAAAHHNSNCTDERLRADAGAGGERADAEPDRRADRSAGRGGAGADLRRVLVSGTNDRTGFRCRRRSPS